MSVVLPIEVYETFEESFGKEKAKAVIKSLETTIEDVTENKWEKTKNELLDRLASKGELKELKEEILKINSRIDSMNDSINSRFELMNSRFDSMNDSINSRFDSMNDSINSRFELMNSRFDSINSRFDSIMKILLWLMGLITVQAVGVALKIMFT